MATYLYAIKYENGIPISVEAKNCTYSDLNTTFHCPTIGCTAILKLCSLNGHYPPHFRKITNHSDFCFNENHYKNKIKDIDPSTFDFEKLYNITVSEHSNNSKKNVSNNSHKTKNKKQSNQELNKISTTFYYLKSKSINSPITSNVKVKDILVDTRTSHIYSKVVFGFKMLEAQILYYKGNILTVGYPINNIKFRYHLKFNSLNDLNFILNKCPKDSNNKLLSFSNNKTFIVVYGKWNNFTCEIFNKKQIFFPKK